MTRPLVELHPCKSAAEFLERLRPSHDLWTGDFESHTGWVFRGQMSAGWGLLPAAYRFAHRDKLLLKYRRLYDGKYGTFDHVAATLRLQASWKTEAA